MSLIRVLAIFAVIGIAAISAPAAAAAPDTLVALIGPGVSPDLTQPIVSYSGSYAGGPIVLGTNTAAGFGVEGITKGTGDGLVGYATSSAGNGVYADARGAGRGLLALSGTGNGVEAQTGGATAYAGSFVNTSSSGSATAVKATSTGNTIVGTSASGNGVVGNSGNGVGLAGVLGVTTASYAQGTNAGVQGIDNSPSSCGCLNYGVFGISNNDGYGVYGSTGESGTGIGVNADTYYGTAIEAAVYGSGTGTALRVTTSGTGGSKLITAAVGGGADVMSLDNFGNIDIAGTLTSNGTPLVSSPGRGAQIESVGDARLVGGNAYVAIDPGFAKHLDPSHPYHVFLTPNGESEGLYVSAKTGAGFTVRENHRARSTLGFDYRIVGTPLHPALRRPLTGAGPKQPRLH
jgi:hypothetical protein